MRVEAYLGSYVDNGVLYHKWAPIDHTKPWKDQEPAVTVDIPQGVDRSVVFAEITLP
jgi:hypothetical protein